MQICIRERKAGLRLQILLFTKFSLRPPAALAYTSAFHRQLSLTGTRPVWVVFYNLPSDS